MDTETDSSEAWNFERWWRTSMKTRKEKVLEVLADGEWHDGYALCHPGIGGSEGLRRLRELREDGHDIEMRRVPGRNTRQYRLVRETTQGELF